MFSKSFLITFESPPKKCLEENQDYKYFPTLSNNLFIFSSLGLHHLIFFAMFR
jgi:hypothetical protein